MKQTVISIFVKRTLSPLFKKVLLFCAAAFLIGGLAVHVQAGGIKVAAVFETPIEEPWVNQIHVALLQAKNEMGIEYTISCHRIEHQYFFHHVYHLFYTQIQKTLYEVVIFFHKISLKVGNKTVELIFL